MRVIGIAVGLALLACSSPSGSSVAESGASESVDSSAETDLESEAESESEADTHLSGPDFPSPPPDMGTPEPDCCGCLCVDPSWSCSEDTCHDVDGQLIGLSPEAGFFEFAGGDYIVNGVEAQSGRARIWYNFRPAAVPEDAPLLVLFNGGPGSATLLLRAYNVGDWTLDPAATGTELIAENEHAWTQFANLLFIDAPNTGFSYSLPLPGGEKPSVGIDPERDAAVVLRTVLHFLARHESLQANPVILAGESYGGVRAQLVLRHLYEASALTSGLYQDPDLREQIEAHFAAVFGEASPPGTTIAQQFGHQILLQALVAGDAQQDLPIPDLPPGCIVGGDIYQCDEELGFLFDHTRLAAERMVQLDLLETFAGVDPRTIAWMHASAREGAYGRDVVPEGEADIDMSQMEEAFGVVEPPDRYYLAFNWNVLGPAPNADHPWDPSVGSTFLRNNFFVDTFYTNAVFDRAIWSPNLPEALESYPEVVSASVDPNGAPGSERPGTIELSYNPSAVPLGYPTSATIRFPTYDQSGHVVPLRQPGELLHDIMQWLGY